MSSLSSIIVVCGVVLSATFAHDSYASYHITLDTELQNGQSQNALAVNVNYTHTAPMDDETLKLNIFFDHNQLNLSHIQPIDAQFKAADAVLADLHNLDNDPTTGQYLHINIPESSDDNSQEATAKLLMRLIFDVKDDFHGAFIHAATHPTSKSELRIVHSVYISQQ